MRTIEKNDVDISKLFQWSKDITVELNGKKIKLYIRLVGDAELNRARTYAIRKSAELRKLLRTPDTDENVAFIPDKDVAERDDIINGLLILQTKTYAMEATKSVFVPLPAEPASDATLEDMEEYQRKVDEYPAMRDEKIKLFVAEKLERYSRTLIDASTEDLYREYVSKAVDQLCETEMLKRFREMCSFFGTYKDKQFRERLFQTFDEFDNANPDLKSLLISEYISLEIDGEVLKKSLAPTQ